MLDSRVEVGQRLKALSGADAPTWHDPKFDKELCSATRVLKLLLLSMKE